MTHFNQDIPDFGRFVAGDTLVVNISVVDGDGAAYDLSNVNAARFVISEYPGSTPVVEATLGSGVVVSDPVGGVLRITVDSADTETLSGDYVHETEITEIGGRVSTVSRGELSVVYDSA